MTASAEEPKRTPLAGRHLELGARMIEFAGFWMPVQYSGVLAEHRAVRTAAGLFDLCHMGELRFEGPDAAENLQQLTTNDVFRLEPGKGQYTLLCNERGGVVDDCLLYRLGPRDYLLVVNAANTDKVREWARARLRGRVTLRDESSETALIAVQGPRSQTIVGRALEQDFSDLPSFWARTVHAHGAAILVSRTGYTGEDGFELYLDAEAAANLWDRLLQVGQADGLVPAGLGARDTLRLEARLPLYGNELTEEISPLEAGLGFAVKFDKGDFVGREALLAQQEGGAARRLIGFEMLERGVPRHGYPIVHQGREVGWVTSGSFSPTLEKEIGMGYVPAALALEAGAEIAVDIRGRLRRARVVEGRFLPRP